jgi:hypothetical protein
MAAGKVEILEKYKDQYLVEIKEKGKEWERWSIHKTERWAEAQFNSMSRYEKDVRITFNGEEIKRKEIKK